MMHDSLRAALQCVDLTEDQAAYVDARIACFDTTALERYEAIERDLNALEAGAVKFLADAIAEIADATIDAINKRKSLDHLAAWAAEFDLPRTGAAQIAIKDALRMTYELGAQHGAEELSDSVETFARRHPRPHVSDRAAIEYLEAKAVAASRRLVDQIEAKTRQILLNAIRTGQPKQETINDLADMFASYGGRPAAYPSTGGVPPSLAQIKTIMRTTMTDAYNHGRIVKFVNARTVRGVFYSATIDTRTTDICMRLNGHTVPIDHPRLHEIVPPNHFNCRSILMPVRRNQPLLRQVSDDTLNEIKSLKAKIGWS